MKRLKKGTPGKGDESPRDSFSNVSVGHGLKNHWAGWLAGEPYWCKAHEHKPPHQIGTKPCLTWLTDGALPCARCRPKVLATWIGWVPIYREQDHAPCIVIVHESVMDLLTDLRYGTRVLVGRSAETSSIFVRRAESQTPGFRSGHEQRQGPRDITPDLLAMWGIPILNEWLRKGGPPSDNAVSLGAERDQEHEEQAPAVRPHTGVDHLGANQAFVDSLDRTRSRLKPYDPSANGPH